MHQTMLEFARRFGHRWDEVNLALHACLKSFASPETLQRAD